MLTERIVFQDLMTPAAPSPSRQTLEKSSKILRNALEKKQQIKYIPLRRGF